VQRYERPVENRSLRVVLAPLRDRGGRMLGTVLMAADITAERELRQEAERSHRLAEVGLMTSGVAHEMKNPLTSIGGFAQLLRRRADLPAYAKAQIERIWDEARRCQHIVSNLLKFTRRRTSIRAIVDVSRVVREALDLVRFEFTRWGLRIAEDYAPEPLLARGDPFELQQVVRNIVTNALDAMRQHPRGGELLVSTRLEGERIVMAFENSGSALENPEKLFTPFYTTKEVGQGTGLGLALSQDIVKRHGGAIQASNTARGVLFRIELPLASGPSDGKPPVVTAAASGHGLLQEE
jgi:signal transduction histidine kinase